MARAAGIRDPAALRAVDYRRAPVRPPAAFFDAVFTDDGGRQRALNWSRGAYGGLWHDGCFKLRACDDCDDIFAELADAAFMDAWLPEYAADAAGTNLVLCRRPDALARFEDGARRGELHIEPVTLERVIESQRGLVYDKRGGLAGRLAAARRRGERMAVKRVAPAARLSVSDRIATALRERCRRAGRDTYRRTRCRGGAAGRWPLAAALAGPRAARRFWLALANVKRGLRPARQP
jgi:hypothetical protein